MTSVTVGIRRARTVAVEPSGSGNSPRTGNRRRSASSAASRSAIRRGLSIVHGGPMSPVLRIMYSTPTGSSSQARAIRRLRSSWAA